MLLQFQHTNIGEEVKSILNRRNRRKRPLLVSSMDQGVAVNEPRSEYQGALENPASFTMAETPAERVQT